MSRLVDISNFCHCEGLLPETKKLLRPPLLARLMTSAVCLFSMYGHQHVLRRIQWSITPINVPPPSQFSHSLDNSLESLKSPAPGRKQPSFYLVHVCKWTVLNRRAKTLPNVFFLIKVISCLGLLSLINKSIQASKRPIK